MFLGAISPTLLTMSIIPAAGSPRPWFCELVFGLDMWLRYLHAVVEYSADPRCVFRIQVSRTEHEVILSDGTCASAEDRIIDLHLWNERVPVMLDKGPSIGPSIAWALKMRRCVELSLRELARYWAGCRDLQDVVLIRGKIAICVGPEGDQMLRLCRQVGFEGRIERSPGSLARRIHAFGQNILVTLIELAVNRVAGRRNMLRRTRIITVYLSRSELMARYGALTAPPGMRAAAS